MGPSRADATHAKAARIALWIAFLFGVDAWTSTPGAGAAAVTFGAIFPEPGSQATPGLGNLHGALLAVEEINAAGGLLGGPLTLANRADRGNPAAGAAAAHELVDQLHVPAIVGSNTSAVTLALAAVTIPAHVVLISPAATTPEITTLEDDGFVFR